MEAEEQGLEKNVCWVEMNGSRNHVALTGPGPFKAIGMVIEQTL